MKNKYNFKQRNKHVQGLRLFKDTLPTKAKKIIAKKGQVYSKTLDNWKYLVGEELFRVCYPKSFKSKNLNDKCLNIMVKHGHEVDLEYSRNLIIDKINTFFGYMVVSSIKLKSFNGTLLDRKEAENKKSNMTKNKFSKKIINIKNKNIKNSLLKLSKVIKNEI